MKSRKENAKAKLAADLHQHRVMNPDANAFADCIYWDCIQQINDHLLTVPNDDAGDEARNIVEDLAAEYPKMADCDLDFIYENYWKYSY